MVFHIFLFIYLLSCGIDLTYLNIIYPILLNNELKKYKLKKIIKGSSLDQLVSIAENFCLSAIISLIPFANFCLPYLIANRKSFINMEIKDGIVDGTIILDHEQFKIESTKKEELIEDKLSMVKVMESKVAKKSQPVTFSSLSNDERIYYLLTELEVLYNQKMKELEEENEDIERDYFFHNFHSFIEANATQKEDTNKKLSLTKKGVDE